MQFSILLFALSLILKWSSFRNEGFQKFIKKAGARVLIKTKDGKYARLFVFNRGKFTSEPGDHPDYDVALVWQDAATGFRVMSDKRKDASFNAAAEGKLRVDGMGVYAQWFEQAVKLAM